MEYDLLLEKLDDLQEGLRSARNKVDAWMDINEACDYTNVSDSTIRRAVRKGELKVSKKTGKLLFRKSSIDSWLNG